ncbi:hypothetical protein J2W23_002214 [Variovorax boronicumulans]|nr:hypothetical protein [Variovorax boronicumulans]
MVVCRNWDFDDAEDGKVRAGVFESTVGVTPRNSVGPDWSELPPGGLNFFRTPSGSISAAIDSNAIGRD